MNGSNKPSFGPMLTPVLPRRQKSGKNVQKSNSFNVSDFATENILYNNDFMFNYSRIN